MSSFIVFLTLTIFIVYCQADEMHHGPPFLHDALKADITKCLDEAGLTEDDLKVLHERPKEPSEKQLCFAKCVAISGGYINKDGMIVPDMLKKNAALSMLDDDTLKTSIKCMETAGKVSTCPDMSKILKCLPKPPKTPE